MPFIIKAAKPAAKEFGTSVIRDVMEGKKPLRKSLKQNGINALKQTGIRLISGSGRVKKTRKTLVINNRRKKKKKKKGICGYKRDIFDTL